MVGAGRFFAGYDLYVPVSAGVGACRQNYRDRSTNLQFISLTFVRMTLGALITGFVGARWDGDSTIRSICDLRLASWRRPLRRNQSS